MKDVSLAGGLVLFFVSLFLGLFSEGSLLSAILRASVVLLVSVVFLLTALLAVVKTRRSEQPQEEPVDG